MVQFAHELRLLRTKAGSPTYREFNARVPYSTAALPEAVSGRKLLNLPVAVACAATWSGDAAECTWTGEETVCCEQYFCCLWYRCFVEFRGVPRSSC